MKEVKRMVMKSRPKSLGLPKVISHSNQTNIQCTCGNRVILENGWGDCENCGLYLKHDPVEDTLDIYELVEFVRSPGKK